MTWINAGRRIDDVLKCRAWTQGPQDHISARAIFKGVIMALMKRAGSASQPSDRDPRGAISCVI